MLTTLLSQYQSKYELIPSFEVIHFQQTIKNLLEDEKNVVNIINKAYPEAKIKKISSKEGQKLLNFNSFVVDTFNKDYVLFLDNIDKIILVNDRSFFAALSDDVKKEKVIKYFQLIEEDEDFSIKFIKILENINFKNDSSFDFCIEKYAKTIEGFFKSENKNLLLNFIFSKNYSYNHSILLLKYCVENDLIDVNFEYNNKNIIAMLSNAEFDEKFFNELITKGIKINLDKKIKDNTLRDYCLKNAATKLLLAIYKNAIPKNKVEKECNYAINYVNEHEIEMVFTFLENKDDIKEFKEKCNLIILENTAQLEKEKIEENFVINKEFDNNKKRL